MSVSDFLNLLCEALEIEAGSLTPGTVIKEVPEWNSLGWLTIMALVDEHFNFQITSKEIRTFVTVGDFIDFLGTKTALAK
jgi:acyl carrier protein